VHHQPAPLVILTGASGSGKTTIARRFQRDYSSLCDVLFFDSIGVPSIETMQSDFGRPEAWQRAMTFRWIERIRHSLYAQKPVLFEGQMRIAFVHEAVVTQGISNVRFILVDCDDTTRAERLHINRAQPGLANPTMMNWARFLREEARQFGAEILDTSHQTIEQSVDLLKSCLFGKTGPQT
jgi:dephospho-CoA kinase